MEDFKHGVYTGIGIAIGILIVMVIVMVFLYFIKANIDVSAGIGKVNLDVAFST